jgi:hypothetical protein
MPMIGLNGLSLWGNRPFSPADLFVAGEQGFWYDPTDIPLAWRRNLLTYTEQFDNAAWSKQANCSVTGVNVGIAPDGTLTADEVTFTATTNDGIFQGFSAAASTTYTASVWVKGTGGQVVQIGCQPSVNPVFTQVTLNGSWQRISATATSGPAATLNVSVDLVSGTTPAVVQVWGAQLELGSTASTYQQIVTPEISFLQYQSQPVLYTDSAGTTPVTAVEQAVGLMLDKSKGLVLGSELVTNGGPFVNTAGWTPSAAALSVVGSNLRCTTQASPALAIASTPITTVAGQMYKVSWTYVLGPSSSVNVRFGSTLFGNELGTVAITANSAVFTATSSTSYVNLRNETFAGSVYFEIATITAKALPGNHAFQTTSAKRPVLRARYNLLEYSEQFDNGYWTKANTTISANAATAPNGTTNADLAYATTTGTDRAVYRNGLTGLTVGASYMLSVYAKASGKSWLAFGTLGGGTPPASMPFFDLQNGVVGQTGTFFSSASITAVGNGWYRCVAVGSPPTSTAFPLFYLTDGNNNGTVTANGTDGVLLWGADLRPTSQATGLIGPTYQRIAAATDYDVVGYLSYLAFDGVDDALTTNSIDFTATDKMTVFAGVRKLSDAAAAILAETSADYGSNNGTFAMGQPWTTLSRDGWGVKGTSDNNVINANAAPATQVMTGIASISGPLTELRRNGASVVSSATTLGTGNFGNYPLFIGARNQTSLYFNGWLTSLIGRGAATSAGQISATETWVNGKTGAY